MKFTYTPQPPPTTPDPPFVPETTTSDVLGQRRKYAFTGNVNGDRVHIREAGRKLRRVIEGDRSTRRPPAVRQ